MGWRRGGASPWSPEPLSVPSWPYRPNPRAGTLKRQWHRQVGAVFELMLDTDQQDHLVSLDEGGGGPAR